MHYLVLGGTGFVGTALVTQLVAEADARVTLLVHRRPGRAEDPTTRVLHGGLGTVDLGALRGDPPERVIHLARISGRGRTGRLIAGMRGYVANTRLVRALRRLDPQPHCVYLSGSLMYGTHGDSWVDETTALDPISFARQYILGERPFLRAQASGDLPVSVVRAPWILGRGSWFETFYVQFLTRHRAVPCYGPGTNWMTFLHVEDCARLLQHIAAEGVPGSTYNVCCHPPRRQQEFAAHIGRLAGLPLREVPLGRRRRLTDPAVAEAFTSSIRLRSRRDAFLAGCPLRHGSPEAAVADILVRYHHVEGVFAQAPQGGPAEDAVETP